MRNLKFLFLCIVSMIINLAGNAQENNGVDMADTMRSNGRIYVVVAVVVTILLGLILYLVRLERKIKRLEKENK